MVYFLVLSIQMEKVKDKIKFSINSQIILTMLVFVIISGLHAYHNQYNFGNWKQLSGGLLGYKTIQENKVFESEHPEELIKNLQAEKNSKTFFSETKIPFGFYTLFASLDRGLLIYAPIFALAFAGIFRIRKKIDLAYGMLLAIIGVNVFLYSSWSDPWGGWAYGPRYLIPSMAILSLFVGIFILSFKNKIWVKLLTFVFFMYSSSIALLGALTTNAVPPKIEADFLGLKYNFLYNFDFFEANRSSSFLYNTYFSGTLSLPEYFVLIWSALILIMLALLFAFPKFDHED